MADVARMLTEIQAARDAAQTTHRLCQHRTMAHVTAGPEPRLVVPFADGHRLEIATPAELRLFRRTLDACADQWRQARGGR